MTETKVAIFSFPELETYEMEKIMEAVRKGLEGSDLRITFVFVNTPVETIKLSDLKKYISKIDGDE